jgi:hypothetical protein
VLQKEFDRRRAPNPFIWRVAQPRHQQKNFVAKFQIMTCTSKVASALRRKLPLHLELSTQLLKNIYFVSAHKLMRRVLKLRSRIFLIASTQTKVCADQQILYPNQGAFAMAKRCKEWRILLKEPRFYKTVISRCRNQDEITFKKQFIHRSKKLNFENRTYSRATVPT